MFLDEVSIEVPDLDFGGRWNVKIKILKLDFLYRGTLFYVAVHNNEFRLKVL
jgi:hypothetical protein